MVIVDVTKGKNFSKVCERAINIPTSTDRVKKILVKGLGNGERGPDFKDHLRNGVIGSVNFHRMC